MITVWKFRGKKKWLVGQYEGKTNNMKDINKAMELARKDCPTGKLIIEGVTAPDIRREKKPEIQ